MKLKPHTISENMSKELISNSKLLCTQNLNKILLNFVEYVEFWSIVLQISYKVSNIHVQFYEWDIIVPFLFEKFKNNPMWHTILLDMS